VVFLQKIRNQKFVRKENPRLILRCVVLLAFINYGSTIIIRLLKNTSPVKDVDLIGPLHYGTFNTGLNTVLQSFVYICFNLIRVGAATHWSNKLA
jgi:hypothetical protein